MVKTVDVLAQIRQNVKLTFKIVLRRENVSTVESAEKWTKLNPNGNNYWRTEKLLLTTNDSLLLLPQFICLHARAPTHALYFCMYTCYANALVHNINFNATFERCKC